MRIKKGIESFLGVIGIAALLMGMMTAPALADETLEFEIAIPPQLIPVSDTCTTNGSQYPNCTVGGECKFPLVTSSCVSRFIPPIPFLTNGSCLATCV